MKEKKILQNWNWKHRHNAVFLCVSNMRELYGCNTVQWWWASADKWECYIMCTVITRSYLLTSWATVDLNMVSMVSLARRKLSSSSRSLHFFWLVWVQASCFMFSKWELLSSRVFFIFDALKSSVTSTYISVPCSQFWLQNSAQCCGLDLRRKWGGKTWIKKKSPDGSWLRRSQPAASTEPHFVFCQVKKD